MRPGIESALGLLFVGSRLSHIKVGLLQSAVNLYTSEAGSKCCYWEIRLHLETLGLLGYERVHLSLCKVADTPFHIQVDVWCLYSTAWHGMKCIGRDE